MWIWGSKILLNRTLRCYFHLVLKFWLVWENIRIVPVNLFNRLIDWLISDDVRALTVPMHLGLKSGPFVPHNLMPVWGNPLALLKFRKAPIIRLLTSSGSKEKETNKACLSEAKASHSHRKWNEFFSSAPHLLHKELPVSRIKRRLLLRALCPEKGQ